MSYKKPILTEIYATIFLVKGTLTQTKFFDIIPKIKESGLTEIEVGQIKQISLSKAQDNLEELLHTSIPRIRCWNDNKTQLVQLSPDRLIINQVGEYLGWDKFESFFNKNLTLVKESLGSISYKSLLLNTIDNLTIPKKEYSLGKYLNCGGNKIPEWYRGSKEAIDISLGRGLLEVDHQNRQIQVKVRIQNENVHINIVSIFHDEIVDNMSITDSLNKLHLESSESFESIITDFTRNKIMEGIKCAL